jgi:acetoacetyl-CoA reductase
MSSQNRIAVVTGGMGGIGTAICQHLARAGATVVATCHSSEEARRQEWIDARKAEGLAIQVYSGDVADAADAARMMAAITSEIGGVDILVNCAGITRDSTLRKMETSQWDQVIQTNLNSVFYCTKPLWDGMINRNFGRVINIASINGQRGQFGQTNYSAAKAGMHGFTMALAQEGAAKGVTVNTISPGYIETAMTAAMREDVRAAIIGTIPMKRMGSPDEIAAVVAFVADDGTSYLTGANIPVNGGLFIH